jgi:hypothetical protein
MNKKLVFYSIGLLTFAIVAYKAFTISMTHDESSSFYYLSHKNIFGYLFDNSVWPNANNHWLNTVMFQLTTKIFGENEFAIRLPNLLAYLLYLLTSYKITSYISNKVLQIAAFLFMLCNPYLLDFFSTARGYGLSLAFVNLALWQCIVFIRKETIKSLVASLFSLLLAALSLFSSLIFIPALVTPVILFLLWKYHKNLLTEHLLYPLVVISIFLVLTLSLTFTPLRALSENAEFKWGSSSLLDAFQSLVFHSAYGQPYRLNEHFTVGLFTAILVYISVRVLKKIKSPEDIKKISMSYMSILTFACLIFGMYLARYAVGTYYPVERKTIIFIPFIGLVFFGGTDLILKKYKNWVGYISVLILLLHLGLSLDMTQVREWWFDRDTKAFYEIIAQDKKDGQVIIGCDWMFHPTLSFYSKINAQDSIVIMNYNKGIDTERIYDYYMIFDNQIPLLEKHYIVLYKVDAGRILLKSKICSQ